MTRWDRPSQSLEGQFFMKFRGPLTHPNRRQKAIVCPTYFSARSKKSRVICCNWRAAAPMTPWVFCG